MIVTVFLDCFDLDKETGIIIPISAEQKTPLADLLTFSQLTQFLTTTDHILRHNLMATKQLYRVRFQRNCGVLKKARCQQVEVRKLHYTVIMPCHIMQLKSTGAPFIVILLEAAGAHHVFNLCKVRRRGRDLIGYRATFTVPGQRGANLTMCAAISNEVVRFHIPTIGPYNT